MSSLYKRQEPIIQMTPAETHAAKEGYLVKNSSGSATLNDSASVPALGVILDGDTTTGKDSIAILGNIGGTVRMRCGGTIAAYALVQQHTDGTVITDATSGARCLVGRALEAGVAGENIEVAPCGFIIYAS